MPNVTPDVSWEEGEINQQLLTGKGTKSTSSSLMSISFIVSLGSSYEVLAYA